MSGFFGIFRPQGGSVDLDAFEQMRKATEREGFDGLETHVEEKIAMGHLMLRVSPEAKYDQQPLRSECGRYLLVGHFRLDYRDELGDKLGLTQSELELTPDSQLVMLAYQKWKEKCVYNIEGDWAFALFDSSSNSLLLAKDRTGYSALFYTVYQGAIYFSSDVNVIGALETIPFEVDMAQFYRLSLPSILVEKGKTLLKEVYHLNGGSCILCNSDIEIIDFQYWQKTDEIKIRYKDDQDYAEHMQSIFVQAIKTRLRTEEKTGIFLSSGLDSMAVAYFSAAELGAKNKKLYSFTSYPYYLSKIDEKYHKVVNEVPLVEKFVAETLNVEPEYLNFPDVNMKDYIDSDLTKDLYYPIISSNTFWIQGILKVSKGKKIKRMLSGQIGNMTISFNSPFIQADNFFLFKFKSLIDAFRVLKTKRGLSNYKVVRNYLISPIYLVFKSFVNSKKAFKKKHLSTSMLFNKEQLKGKTITRNRKVEEFIPGYYFFRGSKKLQVDQLDRYVDFAGMKWYRDSHEYQIEGIDPTSDSRLIDFVLSVPSNQFNKQSQSKFLYQNMMINKLNEEIRNNRNSMIQSFDFNHRISSDQSIFEIFSFIQRLDETTFGNIKKGLLAQCDDIFISQSKGIERQHLIVLFRNISLLACVIKNNKYKFTLQQSKKYLI